MTHVITQQCVATCDTACVDACPFDCIDGPVSLRLLREVPIGARNTQFPGIQMFIDPDSCTDCGACLTECPVSAIYVDDEVPGAYRPDIERNAAFFRDRLAGDRVRERPAR